MLRRLVFLRQRHSERGATAVEYALMVTLIAVVISVAVAAFGTSLRGLFQGAANSF